MQMDLQVHTIAPHTLQSLPSVGRSAARLSFSPCSRSAPPCPAFSPDLIRSSPTFCSYIAYAVSNYAPWRTQHMSLHGPTAGTAASVTELLQLPDFGTVCRHISRGAYLSYSRLWWLLRPLSWRDNFFQPEDLY